MTTFTPLASFATGGLTPCRSPLAAFGFPDFEMRAVTTTRGYAEMVRPWAIAIESFRVNGNGKPAALVRSTASGIGGPSAARAETNNGASGRHRPFSRGAPR